MDCQNFLLVLFCISYSLTVSSGFLHCNQCIKTHNLNYQKQLLDNFLDFFTIRGGPFDLGGVKSCAHDF